MSTPKKKVDGKALIPDLVKVALGTKSFKQVTQSLSADDKTLLSRGLKMDVDEFRSQFASELRQTAQELLTITRRDLEKIKPDSRAYTLAVLIDKATSLESRNPGLPSSVSQTINNYYGMSKDDLLDTLDGRKPITPVSPSDPSNAELLPSPAPIGATELTGELPVGVMARIVSQP